MPPDIERVASNLRTRLSTYKVPKRILAMDDKDVPMMSSGKLDLRVLKERLSDH
jgi:acyl-CoA synthetase (AMP-forming)/AMP-acid ligase II